VLEKLREIVSFEHCALLRTRPGRQAQLFVHPAASVELRATLEDTLVQLHQGIVKDHSCSVECDAGTYARLAVPLVGNDQVIGVVLVRRSAAEPYTERDLRELSVVGAQLAAYLVMVDQARQLDDARCQAEAAVRLKDEFLATVSCELKVQRHLHCDSTLIDEILDLASTTQRGDVTGKSAASAGASPDAAVADPVRILTVVSRRLLEVIRAATSRLGDGPGESTRPLAGIRVLLVDDDLEMRQAATAVLELHGAEVSAVPSAAAALAALVSSRPHVLLSDLVLSGGTGYDLMRELSARNVVVPAAAMTSLSTREDRARTLASGFALHLSKPFHAQELVATVVSLAGTVVRQPQT
jgi:CheY-like chemotaxis protein